MQPRVMFRGHTPLALLFLAVQLHCTSASSQAVSCKALVRCYYTPTGPYTMLCCCFGRPLRRAVLCCCTATGPPPLV